jgi:hypothetical protein
MSWPKLLGVVVGKGNMRRRSLESESRSTTLGRHGQGASAAARSGARTAGVHLDPGEQADRYGAELTGS